MPYQVTTLRNRLSCPLRQRAFGRDPPLQALAGPSLLAILIRPCCARPIRTTTTLPPRPFGFNLLPTSFRLLPFLNLLVAHRQSGSRSVSTRASAVHQNRSIPPTSGMSHRSRSHPAQPYHSPIPVHSRLHAHRLDVRRILDPFRTDAITVRLDALSSLAPIVAITACRRPRLVLPAQWPCDTRPSRPKRPLPVTSCSSFVSAFSTRVIPTAIASIAPVLPVALPAPTPSITCRQAHSFVHARQTDIISSDVDDFEARSPDELSLAKGDRIELIERDDDFGDGWYLGRHLLNGNTGLFPEGLPFLSIGISRRS